jgi:hypothetical protein
MVPNEEVGVCIVRNRFTDALLLESPSTLEQFTCESASKSLVAKMWPFSAHYCTIDINKGFTIEFQAWFCLLCP